MPWPTCSWVQVCRVLCRSTWFIPKGQDSLHLAVSCSVKGSESTTRCYLLREWAEWEKHSIITGRQRNLRQTQDFSAFHPKTLFFGLSDTLSWLADQNLGAQGTEFRSFKNVLINNPEHLPYMGGKHSGDRFPQKQNISRVGRGTRKVSKAETLDKAHLTPQAWCMCVPPRPLSSPAPQCTRWGSPGQRCPAVLGAVHNYCRAPTQVCVSDHSLVPRENHEDHAQLCCFSHTVEAPVYLGIICFLPWSSLYSEQLLSFNKPLVKAFSFL